MNKASGKDIIDFVENGWPGGNIDSGYYIEDEKWDIEIWDEDGYIILDPTRIYDLDLFGPIFEPDGEACMTFAYYFEEFVKNRTNEFVTIVVQVPKGDGGLVRNQFRQFLGRLRKNGTDWKLADS